MIDKDIAGYVLPYYYDKAGRRTKGYKGRFCFCCECARIQAIRTWLRQFIIDPDEWLDKQAKIFQGTKFMCKMCGRVYNGKKIETDEKFMRRILAKK